jgi:hypothetical protein
VTVAAPTAPAIAGNPIPVLIGTTVHVYTASAANSDLVEYVADHLNGNVWNAYDQTSLSGAPKPVGNPSVVLISGAPYGIGQSIPEVWETPASGDLTTFVADHLAGNTWNVYDVSSLSGGPQLGGDPTPIVNGTTVQVFGLGLAATGAAGSVAPATAGSRLPVAAGSSPSPSPFLPTLAN